MVQHRVPLANAVEFFINSYLTDKIVFYSVLVGSSLLENFSKLEHMYEKIFVECPTAWVLNKSLVSLFQSIMFKVDINSIVHSH